MQYQLSVAAFIFAVGVAAFIVAWLPLARAFAKKRHPQEEQSPNFDVLDDKHVSPDGNLVAVIKHDGPEIRMCTHTWTLCVRPTGEQMSRPMIVRYFGGPERSPTWSEDSKYFAWLEVVATPVWIFRFGMTTDVSINHRQVVVMSLEHNTAFAVAGGEVGQVEIASIVDGVLAVRQDRQDVAIRLHELPWGLHGPSSERPPITINPHHPTWVHCRHCEWVFESKWSEHGTGFDWSCPSCEQQYVISADAEGTCAERHFPFPVSTQECDLLRS